MTATSASPSHCYSFYNGNDGLGCAMRWLGAVAGDYGGRFAGVGVDLTQLDLTGVKSIVLETRGDGRLYRAQFPLLDQLRRLENLKVDDPEKEQDRCAPELHDDYGQRFFCGDGTAAWTPIEIPLNKLAQRDQARSFPCRWILSSASRS